MGLFNSAPAPTCSGEFAVAPSAGVETQTEPAEVDPGVGGGTTAEFGNAATPEVGPCACSRVTLGQVDADGGGPPDPPPLPPPSEPVLGGGAFDAVTPPQPASSASVSSTIRAIAADGIRRRELDANRYTEIRTAEIPQVVESKSLP